MSMQGWQDSGWSQDRQLPFRAITSKLQAHRQTDRRYDGTERPCRVNSIWEHGLGCGLNFLATRVCLPTEDASRNMTCQMSRVGKMLAEVRTHSGPLCSSYKHTSTPDSQTAHTLRWQRQCRVNSLWEETSKRAKVEMFSAGLGQARLNLNSSVTVCRHLKRDTDTRTGC